MAKKVFIKSYGCQMNVYDSERMVDILASEGYESADEPDGADLIILNTCHVRERATEKVYSELGRLRRLGSAKIVVAGCVAQAEGDDILRRAPNVDLVLGPQTTHRLPLLLRQSSRLNRIADTEFPIETKFDSLPTPTAGGSSAFLTIQEGCDKFCSFCVVPYTRGAEYSRPAEKVLDDASGMVDQGVREITLLGQNVNAYNGCAGGLAELIRSLDKIEGLDRIRFTTSHPKDMTEDLIRVYGEVESLMPYLHLPVQSGSDRILHRMNRKHNIAEYEGIIRRLRSVRPDIALSSDFIVGHPGEEDEDFEKTLALVRRIRFAQAYSFKYSPRPGTPAASSADHVTEPLKAERILRLQELLNLHQVNFNEQFIGSHLPVLIDRPGRKERQVAGRTPYNQAVHVAISERDESALMGKIVSVFIEASKPNSLSGVLASQAGLEPPEHRA